MAISYKSTAGERWELVHLDENGQKRVCVAEKPVGENQWSLTLKHPDGMSWPAVKTGNTGILDAMMDFVAQKDTHYQEAKRRNYEKRRESQPDRTLSIPPEHPDYWR